MDSVTGSQSAALTAYGRQQAGSATSSVDRARADGTLDAAVEAAKDFETVFVSQMLSHMWTDISTDGLFGGGHAEEVTRSMLVDEYARVMVNSGGIGIADQVRAEILRLQEG